MTPVGPLRVDLGWHLVRSFVEDDPRTPEVNEADEALAGEPTLKPLFGKLRGILNSDRAKALNFWVMGRRQICWPT